jgi:hypothetical protein
MEYVNTSGFELVEMDLRVVEPQVANDLISKYHYSRTSPGCTIAIGHYYKDEIKNLILFKFPVGRMMAQQVMEGGDSSNTFELVRMISLDPKPLNTESYCISKAFKWLKQNMPNIKIIISYADNTMGHFGYSYQAVGFRYYGQSRAVIEYYLDGKRIHERTLNSKFGSASYENLQQKVGDRLTRVIKTETKSRYYYIISQSKTEKKQIEKKIKVKSLPYPKGELRKYDMNKDEGFAYLNGQKPSGDYQTSIFDFEDGNYKGE